MFGFFVPAFADRTVKDKLSILVFDHEKFTPDKLIGSLVVELQDIPYDLSVEKWEALSGTDTGDLLVIMRKCKLLSPEHQDIVKRISNTQRSWTCKDLDNYNINLPQLVGLSPFKLLDHSNPALDYLYDMVRNDIKWNVSVSNRVETVLQSQNFLSEKANKPSRILWISGFSTQNVGPGYVTAEQFYQTVHRVAPVKYFLLPRVKNKISFVIVEVRSIKDAVLLFLLLQHKMINGQRIMIAFGEHIHFEEPHFKDMRMGGYLHVNCSSLCGSAGDQDNEI